MNAEPTFGFVLMRVVNDVAGLWWFGPSMLVSVAAVLAGCLLVLYHEVSQ